MIAPAYLLVTVGGMRGPAGGPIKLATSERVGLSQRRRYQRLGA